MIRAAAVTAALLVAAVSAGCGTGGPASAGNATRGEELFTSAEARCGACHTLASAGSKGTIGPNLDEAFRRPREEEFAESTMANVVLDQIRFPTTDSGMPADLVTGQDAEDIAAYVAQCAANEKSEQCRGPKSTSVFADLGCQSCHSLDGSEGVGPTLKGLFGSQVMLTTGESVKADERYLLESILDPDKQIVEGYKPGAMSSAVKPGSISQADAQKLIAFLKQQR